VGSLNKQTIIFDKPSSTPRTSKALALLSTREFRVDQLKLHARPAHADHVRAHVLQPRIIPALLFHAPDCFAAHDVHREERGEFELATGTIQRALPKGMRPTKNPAVRANTDADIR
jgi:hypothetical protein